MLDVNKGSPMATLDRHFPNAPFTTACTAGLRRRLLVDAPPGDA